MSCEKVRYIIGVICLLLAGCASPVPVDDQAAIHTASPAPLQATPTVAAHKPTPTFPPQPTAGFPDLPFSREDPWLVFLGGVGPYLWASNDDGAGMAQLVDEPIADFAVRPNPTAGPGATIAYITYDTERHSDFTLKLLSLPDGKVTSVTPLFTSDAWGMLEASDNDTLKWSPDGSLLAFVGALNGPSVDAYTYDVASGAITRMSEEPSNAYRLNWSPDGRYLVYGGYSFVGMRYPFVTGVWVVKADGTGTSSLIEEGDAEEYLYYEGWISATKLVLVKRIDLPEVYNGNIRLVDVETGKVDVVLEAPFVNTAFAPEHNTWLLAPSYRPKPEDPLILYKQGQRQEIPSKGIQSIEWLSAHDVFLGQTDDGVFYTITLNGEITEFPMGPGWVHSDLTSYILSISPDGQKWAWYMDYSGLSNLWIGAPMAEPAQVLPALDDENRTTQDNPIITGRAVWSPDSQRLIVFTDQGLVKVELTGLEIAPLNEPAQGSDYFYGWYTAWIP